MNLYYNGRLLGRVLSLEVEKPADNQLERLAQRDLLVADEVVEFADVSFERWLRRMIVGKPSKNSPRRLP